MIVKTDCETDGAALVTILCQGTVAFSSDTGDRMALTMVEQLVNTSYQKVGYYDQRTDNLTFVTNATTGEPRPCRIMVVDESSRNSHSP